jgi:hypothetical protein
MEHSRTVSGHSLAELSDASPVLLIFLRHSGCPFCRETLGDLAKQRSLLAERGLKLVHQDTPERGARWIASYGLDGADQISDPQAELYRQFELGKANWWDLVGPHVWWSGFRATILKMHGISKIVGDVRQLTGAFIVHRRQIVKEFRQRYSGDRARLDRFTCDLPP